MERILVVADTHGKCDKIIKLMENIPFTKVFHLGDLVRDALYIKKAFPDLEVVSVRGNNDPFGTEDEKIVEVSGKKFFLCHGHNYSPSSSLLRLSLKAEEVGADAVLFGHTHRKLLEKEGDIIIFNPGSPERPRGGKASCGIIELDENYFGIAHYDF